MTIKPLWPFVVLSIETVTSVVSVLSASPYAMARECSAGETISVSVTPTQVNLLDPAVPRIVVVLHDAANR